MPHLSPMNWISMILVMTISIMCLNCMIWWSNKMNFPKMYSNISTMKFTMWNW